MDTLEWNLRRWVWRDLQPLDPKGTVDLRQIVDILVSDTTTQRLIAAVAYSGFRIEGRGLVLIQMETLRRAELLLCYWPRDGYAQLAAEMGSNCNAVDGYDPEREMVIVLIGDNLEVQVTRFTLPVDSERYLLPRAAYERLGQTLNAAEVENATAVH